VRLGVYSDMVYRRDGAGLLSNNHAFIRFITSLPPRIDELVLFGRLDPVPGRSTYPVPEQVRFVPLPYYPAASDVPAVVRAVRGSAAAFVRELAWLDAVWVFGPQPMSMLFAALARARRTPLVLGVRHDYPQYIRNRLPGPRWRWAVPVAMGMDLAFRSMARRAPTVALGEPIARRYRRGRAPVLKTGFSLVPRDHVRAPDIKRDWGGMRTIVTVSRLAPEKNPLLLADVLAGLRDEDDRWRLVVIGDGPLREALRERVAAAGLAGAVEFRGEVPSGPHLWKAYADAHVFLHVSKTEGLPQVLLEAQAAGIPIVATEVGGVPEALGHGAAGLLVPPDDAGAAVGALRRLAADPELRERLVGDASARISHETLEAQLDRLAAFLRAAA
jgi:glycosyltransferase involved in cell wall biosynthesis